jgi:hypothetical protein
MKRTLTLKNEFLILFDKNVRKYYISKTSKDIEYRWLFYNSDQLWANKRPSATSPMLLVGHPTPLYHTKSANIAYIHCYRITLYVWKAIIWNTFHKLVNIFDTLKRTIYHFAEYIFLRNIPLAGPLTYCWNSNNNLTTLCSKSYIICIVFLPYLYSPIS